MCDCIMKNSTLWALLGAGAGLAGGIGAYLYLTSKSSASSGSQTIVEISGPTSAGINMGVSYLVYVGQGLSPVSNASVSLYINNSLFETQTTDKSGTTTFEIEFKSAGTYTVYAMYNGIKSDSITVTASTVTCKCNEKYDPTSGTCVPLVPYIVNASAWQSGGLPFLMVYNMNNEITNPNDAINPYVFCSNSDYGCSSTSYVSESVAYSSTSWTNMAFATIKGTVYDQNNNPICNVPVQIDSNYNAGNPFVTTVVFSNAFFGAKMDVAIYLFTPFTVTTDQNGNFTANLPFSFQPYNISINFATHLVGGCDTQTVPFSYLVTASISGYSNTIPATVQLETPIYFTANFPFPPNSGSPLSSCP